MRFYEVYCDVAPKRQALEEANAELAEAQDKLSRIKNKIAVSACGPVCHRGCRSRARSGSLLKGVSTAAARGHSAARDSAQEQTQGSRPALVGSPTPGLAFAGAAAPSPSRPSTLFPQELNANLSNLTSAFEKATAEKIKCQQEADTTNRVISLANR